MGGFGFLHRAKPIAEIHIWYIKTLIDGVPSQKIFSKPQPALLLLISTGIENKLAYTNGNWNKMRVFLPLNLLMSENRRPLGSFRHLMRLSREQYACLVLIYSHFVTKTCLCGFKLHNLLIRICILISLSVILVNLDEYCSKIHSD